MRIAGFARNSLVDYPGHIVSTVFTQGCNLSCPYCHNPGLIPKEGRTTVSERELFSFLEKHRKMLDGVCITGGEPTLQDDLEDFLRKVKALDLKVKLDTNGTNPEVLERLISEKLLDYIAMDVKSSKDGYMKIGLNDVQLKRILHSIKVVMDSGIPYEFRTTTVPGIVGKEDIKEITSAIKGAECYCIQQFVTGKKLMDERMMEKKPYTPEELTGMMDIAASEVRKCLVRNI